MTFVYQLNLQVDPALSLLLTFGQIDLLPISHQFAYPFPAPIQLE